VFSQLIQNLTTDTARAWPIRPGVGDLRHIVLLLFGRLISLRTNSRRGTH